MTQTAIATTPTPESALRCQSERCNKKTFHLTTVKTLTTWTTSSPATKSFSTVYSSPFAMCGKQSTQAKTISALIESILLTNLSTSKKNTLYRIAMTMNLSQLSKLTISCLRGVLKAWSLLSSHMGNGGVLKTVWYSPVSGSLSHQRTRFYRLSRGSRWMILCPGLGRLLTKFYRNRRININLRGSATILLTQTQPKEPPLSSRK